MARTILIGDVHGCREELERLLRKLEPGAGDEMILVGDLVAKGPDSQGVIQMARELGFRAVLGNHDAHVLRIREGTLEKPPKPTHQKVVQSLGSEDWAWLEKLPTSLRLEAHGVIVVHAGLLPGVALQAQPREWLLNLRSITPEGAPSKRVDEGTPWAASWQGPEHVVFGHDAMRGLQQHPHATGIDTGCVYGRSLTALVLPERKLVSVQAKQQYAQPGG